MGLNTVLNTSGLFSRSLQVVSLSSAFSWSASLRNANFRALLSALALVIVFFCLAEGILCRKKLQILEILYLGSFLTDFSPLFHLQLLSHVSTEFDASLIEISAFSVPNGAEDVVLVRSGAISVHHELPNFARYPKTAPSVRRF